VKLTREERARILSGDRTALRREEKPELEESDGYVLTWSRAKTVVSNTTTGATFDYPRRPLVWITYSEPRRHRDGSWRIPFDFHDERSHARFLGPAGAPTDKEKLTDDSARGYRSSAAGAIDELEAVDDATLKAQQSAAEARWAEHREQLASEEETIRQERALREELKRAVRELPPAASQALLAGIERAIQNSVAQSTLPQDQIPQKLPERSNIRQRRTR
jgi:hypothetical protein